jgi:hypothetical protein
MQEIRTREIVLHPFLFAVYPALALLANNIEEVKITVAIRALVISVIVSVLLYFLLRVVLRNKTAAAISTSLILILFFLYGHLYNFLESSNFWGLTLGRHRYLAPISLALLLLLTYAIIRNKHRLGTLNSLLNWMAVIALAIPLFNIVRYEIQTINTSTRVEEPSFAIDGLNIASEGTPRDIYYIILDAYARDDTLMEHHQLDNASFLNQLEEMGFFIARCSQSNYTQTQLSLSSSLNMEYLQDIGEQFSPGNTSRIELQDLIQHSSVRQIFEELGYTTVAFETGFKYTQWEDADIYLSASTGDLGDIHITGGLSDFELMLIRTSAGLILADAAKTLPRFLQTELDNPRFVHRQRILFVLDQLSQLPDLAGPKFVFAHLVIPHPPYVFGPNGEFTDYDLAADIGYPDQIIYLNKQLIPVFQRLISKSEQPPIIILQADHGAIHSPPSKRLNILSAYYFPGVSQTIFYDRVSPVNSFRLLLNNYFGGEYHLKEDIGYFSIYQKPYDFTIIPETRPGCNQN